MGDDGPGAIAKAAGVAGHVHQHPAKNIRVLARALHRDYRRVHEDVVALEAAGLPDRDKTGARAEYDAFDVRMRVAL